MTAIRPSRLFVSMSSQAVARAILLAGVVALLIVPIGCSDGGSADSAPAAQNAAQAAPAAQPAPGGEAPQPRLRSVLKKKKENEEAQASTEVKPAATTQPATPAKPSGKPADKPVDQWTIDEMKSALAGKDIRYVGAVMAQGVGSHGDSQKGGELSQLLVAVAAMPADAPAPAQLTGSPRRKRSSKRGDDDDEPSFSMPQPAAASGTPAAAAAATPTNTPPPTAAPAVPPSQLKIRFGRGADEDD